MATDPLKAGRRAIMIMERAMPFDLPPLPPPGEVARFIAEHGCGTPATVDYLCRHNLRLIPYCLKRLLQGLTHLPPLCDPNDLVQEGFLALHRAAELYDLVHNADFGTYAVYCILGRMRSAIRRASKHSQRHIALTEQNEATLCAAALRDAETLFHNDINIRENQQIVARALKTSLNQREQLIITRRFGLNRQSPQKLKTIAQQHALTAERIRQIQNRALKKLLSHLCAVVH